MLSVISVKSSFQKSSRDSGRYIWWNAGVGLSGAFIGSSFVMDKSLLGGMDAGSSAFPPAVGDGYPRRDSEMRRTAEFVGGVIFCGGEPRD